MKILSQADLERAVETYGILPFFRNEVRGLSIEEMSPPSLLFGGNAFDGCWEWKGPVVRKRRSAYGKFFGKKAGFISLTLLPHFINFRRSIFHVPDGSTDEMLLDIISVNDKISSTELRESIFCSDFSKKRTAFDPPSLYNGFSKKINPDDKNSSRHSLEGPLQRLQMGAYLCISDFRYKITKRGERYGWGVADYSIPENIFPSEVFSSGLSPLDSLDFMVEYISERWTLSEKNLIRSLLTRK